MTIAKKVVTAESVTFKWADETETTVKLSDFSEEMVQRAAIHGFSQKLGDSYSGASGNVETAKAMFAEVMEALKDGDWNRKGGSFGGIWVEAVARATGLTLEEATEKWASLSEEERKGVRAHPHVKLAKAEIEQERATAKAEQAEPLKL